MPDAAVVDAGQNIQVSVSWGASTDPDGNLAGYELEAAYDGTNSYSQIYKGSNTSYQYTFPRGTHDKIQLRVRAYDTNNAYSGYTTSSEYTIDNNRPPVITPTNENLGEVTDKFTVTYQVSDADSDTVTVTEKIGNDVTLRTHTPTLNTDVTIQITDEQFREILNGPGSIVINANDGNQGVSTKSITFTKKVTNLTILGSKQISSNKFDLAQIKLHGQLPDDITTKVFISKSGQTDLIDVTNEYKAGKMVLLTNGSGNTVYYKIVLDRGASDQEGNLTAIDVITA